MNRWDFCPGLMVPRTKPPQLRQGMSMNGWNFSSRPSVPYQKTFVVKLQGMTWYLRDGTDLYDSSTNPELNARRFELFYEKVGTWDSFQFPHPHLGLLEARFAAAVEVPEAIPNSGGLIEGFDVTLIHHNPGY